MSSKYLDSINENLPYKCLTLLLKTWESQILNRNVFSINFKNDFVSENYYKKVEIYTETLQFIEDELINYKPYMLTSRILTLAKREKLALEENDFKLIECYIELEHNLNQILKISRKSYIRPLCDEDITKLQKIAFDSFKFSRFHMDPYISEKDANISRSEWVKNACLGRAEFILVAEANIEPVGFVICLKKDKSKSTFAQLDLIATDPDYRNMSIGFDLTIDFLTHCKKIGFNYAKVGTQAHNIDSLRLYEKVGFLISNSFYTFHKHVI